MITYEESNTKFRFGDMSTFTSMTCAKIPASIGNKNVIIETDVINQVKMQ